MSIKTKVMLGVIFLFSVILGIGGMSLYYVNKLSQESEEILKDNYESIQYTTTIIAALDSLNADQATFLSAIDESLQFQEANITETGERELTNKLRIAFEQLRNNPDNDTVYRAVRRDALAIQELNMQAIERKNEQTQRTASDVTIYLVIIATICTLAAFTFVLNFPGYIADPIVQLTKSIKSIAGKNYEERLHFDRTDEFEELAEAFNQMAEKLDEYEHSNLARIIFEKKRIETIINRMSDPVIGIDENGRVIFANDEAIGLLNIERGEIIGKYAPDVAVTNDLLRSLIQTNKETKDGTLIKVIVDGKENFFSKENITVRYVPTGEKSSLSIGNVIILKNVTSYKELDLAKTNFIATISHELKTPIASLQMCVKLLDDKRVGELNDEQHNVILTLKDEVTRLSKLTNELLDLSQVETGNIKLDIRETEPSEIVSNAIDAVRMQSDRKGIQMLTMVNTNGALVHADKDKTTWVLVNLLTNAVRYSPENGIVTVSVERVEDTIRFAVKDNGPGIERKYLPRVFERFFQVPGTPSGTGLGLAISREFIEAQGGRIYVESEYGQGCVFSFNLMSTRHISLDRF